MICPFLPSSVFFFSSFNNTDVILLKPLLYTVASRIKKNINEQNGYEYTTQSAFLTFKDPNKLHFDLQTICRNSHKTYPENITKCSENVVIKWKETCLLTSSKIILTKIFFQFCVWTKFNKNNFFCENVSERMDQVNLVSFILCS